MRTSILGMCCVVVLSAPPYQAAGQEGTDTGKRIGNAIAAAITTAFPAVERVIDAVWPNRKEKKTAEDAKVLLERAKKDATAKLRADLDTLKSAAQDLAKVRRFLTAAAVASSKVIAMRTHLASIDDIDDRTQQTMMDLWNPARNRLTDLRGVSVDEVSDPYLRRMLEEIRDATTDTLDNVTNQIKDKRARDLRLSLADLEPKLSGVTPLASLVIADLSSSLIKAVDNVAGAAGPSIAPDPDAAEDWKENLNLLASVYAKRK